MIGRRIGRFRVLEKVGEGGMATVWKAHDELLDRTVALKVLADSLAGSADARRRFRHEAEVAARLDHPGIAHVLAAGEDDGVAYLAMAFVDGETLSQRVTRRLPPIDEAVEIVRVAATALGYAHANAVVHRDVTSRNVMVARDGRVFVLDFGLALAAGISRITSHGTTLGTVAYMAPEVIAGGTADERSDLYGLGIVFYEALTGTLPFAVEAREALSYAALHLTPRPPRERRPEITADLERIVLKLIERDPDRRHASADELLADLRGLPARGSGATQAASPSPAARALAEGDPLYLAVLPFAFEGGLEDDLDGAARRLAADLTSILGGALAELGRIHVVADAAEGPSGEDMEALRAFARRAGTQLLLHGTVRRQGYQLRVSYALTDPEAGARIGGGTLGGAATELFDFEDRVVAHVRAALGGRAVPGRVVPRPSDPAAPERYTQAMNYLKRHDNEASVDGAIHLLEQLTATEGHQPAYLAGLARAYLRKLEHTQLPFWEGRAAEACRRACEAAPDDPEVRLALGELERSAGRLGPAAAQFEWILRERSDHLGALLGLARAYADLRRMDEAEAVCLRAIELHPDDWRGHILLGWIHLQQGAPQRALDPLRRVLELTPDNARGYYILGNAAYRLDDFERAIAAYRKSIEIQPSRIAFGNLGAALYFTGRRDEAIGALRKATELAPSDPIQWGNLGNACHWVPGYERESAHALERAIGLMRERLDRNPSLAEGWAWLAGWLSNLGRGPEAEEAIRRALDLAPGDGHIMCRAGHVHHRLGHRSECLRWLRAAERAGYGIGEVARSIEFAPLRDDPEFMGLLRSARVGAGGGGTTAGQGSNEDSMGRPS